MNVGPIVSLRWAAADWIRKVTERLRSPVLNQQVQRVLWNQYVLAKATGEPPYERLADLGFRCYSQYEEDGIILYLLAVTGARTRVVVEMCCGAGDECMATNLIVNHGFKGYLFDGNPRNTNKARRFFASHKDCMHNEPEVTCSWITKDNVNQLLLASGVQGEVDLLSLDLDGNDYFIWQAIDVIRPRVCVFETQDIIPSDLSLTVPYKADRDAMSLTGPEREFRSVSLAAMVKLSEQKGYSLVGSHRHGFNVFFVRNDLIGPMTPLASIAQVHDNHWTRRGRVERWPKVKDFPWEAV